MKAATTAFTFKTLLRHYAKWALTPSRGLLRDCTTGCGTDGALHSTNLELGVLHVLGDVLDHAQAAQVLPVTTSLSRKVIHKEFFFYSDQTKY